MSEAHSPGSAGKLSRETLGLMLGFVGVVIFAGTLPATRLAVDDLSPGFVTMGRAAVAGLMALAVLVLLRRPLPAKAMHWDFVIVALCLIVGFPGFTSLAMQTLPASHGGVIIGILPLATAICGALFAGDRPSPAYWICGILGAALVVGFAMRKSGMRLAPGDVYLFMAVAVCAIGYAFSARLSRQMPGWEVISWALVLSLPASIPISFWLMPTDFTAVSTAAWLGFSYTALMSMYLGFFAWNAGLALGGVARVSQVQLLQSFVTLLISAYVLEENVDLTTFLLAAAVVGVVLLGRKTSIKRA